VASQEDPPPVAPLRPDSSECCQGGCDRCVFVLFDEALERYELELRAWQERRRQAAGDAQG
jgi:hypothetical protein